MENKNLEEMVLEKQLEKLFAPDPSSNGHGKEESLVSGLRDKAGYDSIRSAILRAVKDDMDYRAILKTAYWEDLSDCDRTWAALKECRLYGVPIDFVMDRVVARSARIQGGLVNAVINSLTNTNTNITTSRGNGIKSWFGMGKKPDVPLT